MRLNDMRLKGLAVLLLALSGASPTLGSPVIFGSHYEERGQANCPGSCSLHMSPVPAGRILIVTRVICSMSTKLPVISADIAVISGVGGSFMRQAPLGLGSYLYSNTWYYTKLNEQVAYAVGSGKVPRVSMTLANPDSNTAFIDCQISGKLFPKDGPGPTPEQLD